MPVSFTKQQQEQIRERLFREGVRLFGKYGVQRTTVSKLTAACGIAKGSFYSFYGSKEEFILALAKWADGKTEEMLAEKLKGRKQISTREFFEFFREFLYSEYDLMNGLSAEDFLWLKTHTRAAELFDPDRQIKDMKAWLALINDVRDGVDPGIAVNLIKSIYAMREHRETLAQASLGGSIEIILRALEIYISGKGEIL
ncbi:MAG: TetR/AcrR family transcriptional regulator [Ruminococcus sp.]|nr:TetR/AcrR family transcriptional regulator [Ruminococcus sp.]